MKKSIGPPIKPLERQRWRLPKLSEDDELELVRRARREKAKLDELPYERALRHRISSRAIEELLKHGHSWVLRLTKKNRSPDRVAVGMEALWRAFLDYDLTRNQPVRFKTLAWAYIEQALANEARAESRARRKAGESYSDEIASDTFRYAGSDRPGRGGGWSGQFDAYVERDERGVYRVPVATPQIVEMRILVNLGHGQLWLDLVGGGVGPRAAKPEGEPEPYWQRYRRVFSNVLTGEEMDEMTKRLSVRKDGPRQKFEPGPKRHNGGGAVVLQRIGEDARPQKQHRERVKYIPGGVSGLLFNQYDD